VAHAVPPAAEMVHEAIEPDGGTVGALEAGQGGGACDRCAGKQGDVGAGPAQGVPEIFRPGLDATTDVTETGARDGDAWALRVHRDHVSGGGNPNWLSLWNCGRIFPPAYHGSARSLYLR